MNTISEAYEYSDLEEHPDGYGGYIDRMNTISEEDADADYADADYADDGYADADYADDGYADAEPDYSDEPNYVPSSIYETELDPMPDPESKSEIRISEIRISEISTEGSPDDNQINPHDYTNQVYERVSTDVVDPRSLIRKFNCRSRYAGKTIRCKNNDFYYSTGPQLQVRAPTNEVEKNVYLIGRSDFDQHFEINRDGIPQRLDGSKQDPWRNVMQILTENATAVRIPKKSNLRHWHRPKFEFDLPITSEVIKVDQPEIDDTAAVSHTWRSTDIDTFMWRGKMYHGLGIYARNNSSTGRFPTFDLLGTYQYIDVPKGMSQLKAKMKIRAKCLTGAFTVDTTNPTGKIEYHYTRYHDDDHPVIYGSDTRYTEKFTGTIDYVEFDFGSNVSIDGVATMGMPHIAANYPQRRRKTGMPINCWITYALEQKHHYTTKYAVLIRQTSSKKWVSLGPFFGNNDRFHEKFNKFDTPIFAQYIRIIPLDYRDSPSMSIRFFGTSSIVNIKDTSNAVATYTVAVETPRNYMLNYGDSGIDRWNHPREEDAGAKRTRRRSDSTHIIKQSNYMSAFY